MVKPFDSLYEELEDALKAVEEGATSGNIYLQSIEMTRKAVERLRVMGGEFMKTLEREIEFFRDVWPVIP